MQSRSLRILFSSLGFAAVAGLAAHVGGCTTRGPVTGQGWSEEDRAAWYQATQGSRLIPYAWFSALEQPDSTDLFADEDHLASFGYLKAPEGRENRLPVGFAIDRQPDDPLKVTRLRWYEGQRGDTENAEPWVGLNCSACHTGEISYEGTPIRIEGGPGLGDYQSFVEALDAALVATHTDADRWERFAGRVLADKDSPENRALLKSSLASLIDWQEKAERLNRTPLRSGFARVDAFGHIYNKIVLFSGAADPIVNPADAPVSYPFLWNISKQGFVQWNGIAQNSRIELPGGSLEYGALGRNTGEVIGVFGEVIITPPGGTLETLKGYTSSVNVTNLDRMETMLLRLKAPEWPDVLPDIDEEKAEKGKALFKTRCANCHKTPDMLAEGEPTEVMEPFNDGKNQTDIWMACNAFTYQGITGRLRGTKEGYLTGEALGPQENIATMLAATVKGTLVGKKGDILASAANTFFGIERLPGVVLESGLPAPVEARRKICMETEHRLLAYKARPLDGIWATAPYLHNGSVPTLYDLLLPADQRPASFWIGSREFDPVKVGYVSETKPDGMAFEFRVADDAGPIRGNSNAGHDYGASSLSEDDRWALVEYMKTLK